MVLTSQILFEMGNRYAAIKPSRNKHKVASNIL